jgi:predicted amidohydrolase
MRLKAFDTMLVVGWAIALASCCEGLATEPPKSLKIGVAQFALEPTLAANRDKIAAFIGDAKSRGCRVVVFPETALYWPPETRKAEIDASVESLRNVVAENKLYALIGGLYKRDETDKPFERLLVIDPTGNVIHTYHKMWQDARFNECPGIFEIDGVPCAAALCADRWIRSVEDLPAVAGAKVLFECSNNYANEWLPELGHYWNVPRAIRNEVFVVLANTAAEDRGQLTPGHGHSAVIRPDGATIASAGEESDTLLVSDLDLSLATGQEASARLNHPAFKSFWEAGIAMLHGERRAAMEFSPLSSSKVELKIAAAQMACSRKIEVNVATMIALIRSAAEQRADVVAFPELALTGANDEDIRAASQGELKAAVERLQRAAAESKTYVAFGLPWADGSRRTNCAIVIGTDGRQLTRYEQLVIDRPELFAAGTNTSALWFSIKGVPCVVTLGRDALWSEIAELAAWRGAQVHLHLAYDRDTSQAADLRRQQLWANLASFRTFTATVNAASPVTLEHPSAPASGGSVIWDDYHRASSGKAGGYFPHSAVRITGASHEQTILYASQRIPQTNPQFKILTDKTNRPMTAWYVAGANAISSQSVSTGPYVNGTFRGRIAYSADGNHNDPDDWAASPMALAILAEAGLKDRLVHFHYNCILPETNPDWEKIHAESVLGAAKHYGYDPAIFFDCRKDLKGAIAALTKEIDASTAENPLYFIVAGPMEVPYLAIQQSQPDKRQFVYCISHSRWNDGYASKYKFTHTKRSVIDAGVNWVQIRDQNRLLSLSPYGQPAAEESFAGFFWMRDSGEDKVRFLWDRMLVSKRPDPSDAGMAYFLATGDEDADPKKLQRLIGEHRPSLPTASRSQIRLEAENFREFVNYEVDDRSDRNSSHRLSVRPTNASEAATIRTRFKQPYAALNGRYDIEVRYLSERGRQRQIAVKIADVPQGGTSPTTASTEGWASQVFRDVAIRDGDGIAVTSSGDALRLDYIQLNAR